MTHPLSVVRSAVTSLAVILTALLAVAPVAVAEQASKVPRLGVLVGGSPAAFAGRVEAFRQGLRDLGYVEGQNIVIEYRWAEGKTERLAASAAQLVALNVDIIVTHGTPPTRAAKDATSTIPIVMYSGDAVATGLVANLARPGANVTGSSYLFTELAAKRLEVLREAVPGARRVAVLVNPLNASHPPSLDAMTSAARSIGVELVPVEVRAPTDFEHAFAGMIERSIAALLVLDDFVATQHRARIADLAVKHRLPSVVGSREEAEAGALLAYGPDFFSLWRRHATFVDKILKGAKPANLPVEQPTEFEFVLNKKTAKTLGLPIPASLLLRANHIIE